MVLEIFFTITHCSWVSNKHHLIVLSILFFSCFEPKLHKKSSSSAGSSVDKSKKKEKLTRGKTYDGGRRKSKEYNTRKSRAVIKSPKPKPRSKNNQGSDLLSIEESDSSSVGRKSSTMDSKNSSEVGTYGNPYHNLRMYACGSLYLTQASRLRTMTIYLWGLTESNNHCLKIIFWRVVIRRIL